MRASQWEISYSSLQLPYISPISPYSSLYLRYISLQLPIYLRHISPPRSSGEGAAALRRLVSEVDDEIAACQAVIVRDQRWEQRVTVRDTGEM